MKFVTTFTTDLILQQDENTLGSIKAHCTILVNLDNIKLAGALASMPICFNYFSASQATHTHTHIYFLNISSFLFTIGVWLINNAVTSSGGTVVKNPSANAGVTNFIPVRRQSTPMEKGGEPGYRAHSRYLERL